MRRDRPFSVWGGHGGDIAGVGPDRAVERAAVPGLETAEQDIFVQMEHLLDRDAAGGASFTYQDAEMEKRLQRKEKNRARSGFPRDSREAGADSRPAGWPCSPISATMMPAKGDETMEAEFSERLRKYRKARNLTQQELADKLGVSGKSVSRWELGVSHS